MTCPASFAGLDRCQSKVEMAGPQQSRNVRLGSSSWALSLGQRFAAEGGSIVVRLLPRFLLRLESLEERAHFAEAIRHGRVCGWRRWPSRSVSSHDALFPTRLLLGEQFLEEDTAGDTCWRHRGVVGYCRWPKLDPGS